MAMTLRQAIKKANAAREKQLRAANMQLAIEDVTKGFHHLEICAKLDAMGEDDIHDEWSNSITGERYDQ